MVHIGKKIKEVVKEKGIRVTDFSEKINCSRRNAYSIFGKHTIDTGMLLRISRIVEHNFFKYYMPEQETRLEDESISCEEKPPEELQSTGQSESENRVMQLEREVTYLTEINKFLREKVDNLKA